MNNPYTILGLNPDASLEECKLAFRKLAKACHPDLHPNDPKAEAKFKEIKEAYDAIINPPEEPRVVDPWSFFHQSGRFEDLFTQLRRNVIRELAITLEDAFHGKTISLNIAGREVAVKIPAGVEDGMRIVVPNTRTAQSDNMQLMIRILPHARFHRQGAHLGTIVPVTAFDILLGNDIEVENIDGHMIRVAIPPNFDSVRKLRIAGQGMPTIKDSRGDLLVELFVQYPVIPEEHLTQLRQIAEAINH